MDYNKKTFDSGLRLLHIFNNNSRTITVSVLCGVGSYVEDENNNGISHFIEHMMFKGTKKRNALQIPAEIESAGATINAFTSKLNTCYYTICLQEEVEKCVEILSDILTNSTFLEEEIEREKKVVLEEIAMSEDDNEGVCYDLLDNACYSNSPLGKSILGPAANIKKFTRQDLFDYVGKNYCANNILISISGNIELDEATALIEKYFEGKFPINKDREWKDKFISSKPQYIHSFKDIEQANISIGIPAKYEEKDCIPLKLATVIFGGGMSSRLFQTIREKHGLAYSVWSSCMYRYDNAFVDLYIGTNVNSVEKALSLTKELIDDILKTGFTDEEVEKSKKTSAFQFAKLAESQISYLRFLSGDELYYEKIRDIDELLNTIKNTTKEEINSAFRKYYDLSKASVSYVGRKVDANLLDVLVKS